MVRISYDDPGSLDTAFRRASAIIHLAGILVERPGSTYNQANVEPARSVVEAAKRCVVAKFVLVSATGADEKSSNGYYRSKGQAEAVVRASGLNYTILRAPLANFCGRGFPYLREILIARAAAFSFTQKRRRYRFDVHLRETAVYGRDLTDLPQEPRVDFRERGNFIERQATLDRQHQPVNAVRARRGQFFAQQ